MKFTLPPWEAEPPPLRGVLRLRKNIWGNWIVYISGRRWRDFESEYDAQQLYNELLATGRYTLPVDKT